MLTIKAERLLDFTTEQLWSVLTGTFTLCFHDGELVTNAKMTLYSSYAWDFHREYRNTPLSIRHHVQSVLKGGRLGSDTHLELLGTVMWAVYDHYTHDPAFRAEHAHHWAAAELDFRDTLSEKVYRLTNELYNSLSLKCEEYPVSISITDFIDVTSHPKVREANDALEPTQASIKSTYGIIKGVLNSPTELPDNPISRAVRSNLVNIQQVLQCVSARGFLTEIDSMMFDQKPVLRGYVAGLRTLYNSMIESRSAAKSLIFSKAPLQQAEYFSRRLQLMSQIVERLHPGDCGTTEFVDWLVRPEERAKNGEVIRRSDLKQLDGKYYLDDSGSLSKVGLGDKHLEGTKIRLRSVLRCAHPDPGGICATCFGELWLSVPAGTNIGHMCCTSMTQKSSQNVLSVKHLDGSSEVEGAQLDPDERNFLVVGVDDNSYLLAPRLRGKKVTILVAPSSAPTITDVKEAASVTTLILSQVSRIRDFEMIVDDGTRIDPVHIGVNINKRLASLTYQMLHHIREHGWTIDARGNYCIDMEGFDWTQPVLTLPLQHVNMSDHSKEIAEMLESKVEDLQKRDSDISPEVVLVELYDLVNDKLKVNLAVLEVILLGSMIVSAQGMDYALPKPWTSRGLGVMSMSMLHRSLSAAMAYEGHRDVITNPVSFTEHHRPSHPMDALLMPYEVSQSRIQMGGVWQNYPYTLPRTTSPAAT